MSENPEQPRDDDPQEYDAAAYGAPFVVQWEDGSFSVTDNDSVSRMFDLADCGQMDGVKAVLATDQDGNVVPVTVGKAKRDPDWDGSALVYASSPVMAGTLRVGTVFRTDH